MPDPARLDERDMSAKPDPERFSIRFTRFRTIRLDHGRELHIDLVDGPDCRSVSLRLFKSKGRGRELVAERPVHLFREQIAVVAEALTAAGAAIKMSDP